MPVLLETAQSFTNEAGEARTLEVTDVETDRSYFSSQPYCRRSSTLTLTGLGSRIWTIWQFTNIEDPRGQSVFDQRLTLTVTTSVVGQVGPPASPVYDLTLQDLTVPANSGVNPDSGVAHAYDPTRTINGVSYSDVLEASIPRDGRYGPLALPEADWVRIVIARGVGLVQYELRNGQMFTRQ